MNINEDISQGKTQKKSKGCANRISYISAAMCSLLPIGYHINAKTYKVLYYDSRLVV